jgi:hypothetical protein
MTTWKKDELEKLGRAEEVQIASWRRDGTLRKPVTIWAVPHDGSLYIRSVKGRDSAWFRGTQETHQGRIRGGAVEKDVSFAEADPGLESEIDAEYRTKYRRYAGRILNSVLTPPARSSTLELRPS